MYVFLGEEQSVQTKYKIPEAGVCQFGKKTNKAPQIQGDEHDQVRMSQEEESR